jgi:hypothetical protein
MARLPCTPSVEDFLRRSDLDLMAEARPEMLEDGIVGFVRDTAQCVRGKDHAIAGIDCTHDGREDAYISLTA